LDKESARGQDAGQIQSELVAWNVRRWDGIWLVFLDLLQFGSPVQVMYLWIHNALSWGNSRWHGDQ